MSAMPIEFDLDRSSPVPLYFQLAQQLELAIQKGRLKPGDHLEPEVELAQRTGLSRPTVRQAMQELVKKGILVRRRGIGTQVAHAQLRRPVGLTSLYDDLKRGGSKPTTTVLSLETVGADATVAEALGIAEGDPVLYVQRLRLSDSDPLAVLHNWLPADLLAVTEAQLERQGLYDLMRRAGIQLKIAHQQIGAKAASRAEAKQLDLSVGSPLLTLQRTTYDATGRAIEWSTSVYRADSYSFETTLTES